ncbi:hypothetical protein [uncultured Oxalicibacterium sp.]|uniref:hypothetical protein n=1 Tax=uncultured Oxalicibacterium sp. TaxID=1168540 RepID=UPI0025DF1241|nr:hypothetical protein [uncultured Oxalicibacterium sp.]
MKRMASVLLALSLTACNSDNFETVSSTAPRPAVTQNAEFPFTPREFAEAFNTAARLYDKPFQIAHIEVRHGAVQDYFQQILDTGISLTAGVSKETGRITSITALVNRHGALQDRELMLAISEIVTTATNPTLSTDRIAGIVASMLQELSPAEEGRDFPQRFINQVRYVVRSDRSVGYWWIANPIE